MCAAVFFTEKQAYQLVSIKTVILLGGITPLATALKKTGAAQQIADLLITLIGGSTNVYFITVVIFLLTTIMTQFMSNVVTVTLLMPIVISVAHSIGVIPSALVMVLGIAYHYVHPQSHCLPSRQSDLFLWGL